MHLAPTQRKRAVGTVESNAPSCQSVDIGRLRLFVAAEMTDPVIEIVHSNEQDVGLGGIGREKTSGGGDNKCGENEQVLHGRGNVRAATSFHA